ncbi:hypothetical protein LSAT2_002471, partial [Lamellibrachia satsuma]
MIGRGETTGGSLVEEAEVQRASERIFAAPKDYKSLRACYEVCQNQPSLLSFPQMLFFLKGFTEENRTKLGTVIGICVANGLGEPTCLPAVFKEHLLKESELPRSATRLQSALLFPLS